MSRNIDVAVIGGGMWGRALAYSLSQKQNVGIASRRTLGVLKSSIHKIYQIPLSQAIKSKYIILAIKSSAIREWLENNAIDENFSSVIVASKGIETSSGKFICDIFSEFYDNLKIGYLMGPSFAKEVLDGMPCALNIHTHYDMEELRSIFPNFIKIYFNDDVIGGEVAGAYKNVIAIAGGISDGLNLGNNAKASMIARGLVEMCRFGMFFGAKEETFIGLSGAGDLFLTANSPLSRNYRVGLWLAEGRNIDEILESLGEVAEGVLTTKAVIKIAQKYNIYTPIAQEVLNILNGGSAKDSVMQLLS